MKTWPRPPLGSLVETIVPARDKPEQLDGPIPWVRIEDFDGKWIDGSRSGQGVSPETIARMNLRAFPAGTVACTCSCNMGTTAIVRRPLITNQTFIGLRPRSGALLPEFLYYSLGAHRDELNAQATGAIQSYLSRDDFRRLRLPIPPPIEQRAIADYLDTETARIDALIAKKQHLERRLAEHVFAAIQSVVWEGHSQRVPLMYRTETARPIMYGIVLPGPDVDQGVAIVKGGDVAVGRLTQIELCKTTAEIEAPYARARLRSGDLVFAIRGGIGDVRIVPAEIAGANITQDVARVAPANDVDSRWLHLVLRSASAQAEVAARTTGATVRGLNIRDLKRIGVPPSKPARQDADLKRLLPMIQRQERICDSLRRQLDLLREHRQALITAAVTGELSILGVA